MPTSVMRAKAVWGREEKSKARMKKKKDKSHPKLTIQVRKTWQCEKCSI